MGKFMGDNWTSKKCPTCRRSYPARDKVQFMPRYHEPFQRWKVYRCPDWRRYFLIFNSEMFEGWALAQVLFLTIRGKPLFTGVIKTQSPEEFKQFHIASL